MLTHHVVSELESRPVRPLDVRARRHAALGDPVRLAIVDALVISIDDAYPPEEESGGPPLVAIGGLEVLHRPG